MSNGIGVLIGLFMLVTANEQRKMRRDLARIPRRCSCKGHDHYCAACDGLGWLPRDGDR